jgi:hypothetical protein
MLAIAEIEGGSPDLKVHNESSNSYDAGYMQFNNRYLSEISKQYSYNYEDMVYQMDVTLFFWQLGELPGILNRIKDLSGRKLRIITQEHQSTI